MHEQNLMGNRLRRLLFLSPALFTAAVILAVSPAARPVSAEIPASPEAEEAEEGIRVDPAPEPEPASVPEPEEGIPDGGEADIPEPLYEDGNYEGVSRGYGGDVRVSVTVDGGRIAAVDILASEGEDPAYFAEARAVTDRVLTAQSAEVNAVSGATFSSRGILEAVRNALEGGKGTP